MKNMMRRSVAVEARALEALHTLATPRERAELGMHRETRDAVFVSVCRAEPGILLNRCIGLGVASPMNANQLNRLIGIYREHGVKHAFISMPEHAATEDVARQFAARGLREARAWTKFRRGMHAAEAVETDLDIHRIGAEHAEAFARIAAQAFDLPRELEPVLARLPEHPDFYVFMSFAGGIPAGCGVLFVHEGIGWLDWAATDPAFRKRGSQRAVMAARINHARELGCELLLTATGEAVPGDPQHSWKNIVHAGFEPLYRIRNFAISAD